MKHCFLALHLACGLSAAENLQKEWEAWWEAGHTQMSVWDHSWLTPRLVCGFRFLRIPAKSGIEGGMFLPLPVMGVENERLSGEYTNLERKERVQGKTCQVRIPKTGHSERMGGLWVKTIVLFYSNPGPDFIHSPGSILLPRMSISCGSLMELASSIARFSSITVEGPLPWRTSGCWLWSLQYPRPWKTMWLVGGLKRFYVP